MKHTFNHHWFLCLPLLLTLALVAGCSDDGTSPQEPQISGTLVSHSDCGGFDVGTDLFGSITTSQTAVAWEWDGQGTLKLRHINAAFNCCPTISCEFTFDERIITVQEMDEGACDCICLFDADFKINGLTAGMYTIKFNELYLLPDDPKIEFSVSLTSAPATDTVVVDRDHYPWMPEQPSSGSVTAFSDCGGFVAERTPSDPPEDSACVSWEYDAQRTLWLTHQNAIFNCGLYDLTSVITLDTGGVWIEEKALINPMYCLCPFDIEMRIDNVPPEVFGVYIIGSQSAGLEFVPTADTVTFLINLAVEESGYHCYALAPFLDY